MLWPKLGLIKTGKASSDLSHESMNGESRRTMISDN